MTTQHSLVQSAVDVFLDRTRALAELMGSVAGEPGAWCPSRCPRR